VTPEDIDNIAPPPSVEAGGGAGGATAVGSNGTRPSRVIVSEAPDGAAGATAVDEDGLATAMLSVKDVRMLEAGHRGSLDEKMMLARLVHPSCRACHAMCPEQIKQVLRLLQVATRQMLKAVEKDRRFRVISSYRRHKSSPRRKQSIAQNALSRAASVAASASAAWVVPRGPLMKGPSFMRTTRDLRPSRWLGGNNKGGSNNVTSDGIDKNSAGVESASSPLAETIQVQSADAVPMSARPPARGNVRRKVGFRKSH